MLKKKVLELLKNIEFINVATCNLNGRPNAAPKFLLKYGEEFMYLVDYTIGTTYKNLQLNSKISLSFLDSDTLIGYQVNGSARIIDKGKDYDRIVKELHDKQINLSVDRIIEGLRREKGHTSFEVVIPDRFVIFKVKIEEIVEIGNTGGIKREKGKA